MDPVTMMGVSMATSVIGGGISAMGQAQQGEAAASASRYQAQVARNNAEIARRNADQARVEGNQNSMLAALETRAMTGRQRATFAANGIDVNSGTALDIQANTVEQGFFKQLMERYSGEKKAYNYLTQASGMEAEAGLRDQAASNYEEAAGWNVLGTLVGTASSVSGRWANFRSGGQGYRRFS